MDDNSTEFSPIIPKHSFKRSRGRPSRSAKRNLSNVEKQPAKTFDNHPVKKGRGRPRKNLNNLEVEYNDGVIVEDDESVGSGYVISTSFKNHAVKNGSRSFTKIPKYFEEQDSADEDTPEPLPVQDDETSYLPEKVRRRGRPRKIVKENDVHLKLQANNSSLHRKRGRPRKIVKENDVHLKLQANNSRVHPKRGRGRPRSEKSSNTDYIVASVIQNMESTPLKRGRPSKNSSNLKKKLLQKQNLLSEEDPRLIIPQLCRLMYKLKWATGTGGGISIRSNDLIYMAPSGVQKEMINEKDIFICDESGEILERPDANLKLTECAPLFMNAFKLRQAGAVLHSHGQYAVLASLLSKGREFRITHLEMLKGIKKGTTNESYRYDETLIVPIVENVLYERDLTDRMQRAMEEYPDANAVLVRRHGVYIWGDTWQRAKTQAECYHYLFEVAVRMARLGVVPDEFPTGEHGIE